MRNLLTNMMIIAGVLGAAGLSGCAAITETAGLDTDSERHAAGSMVIGKFELVRNGQNVPLRDGLFSNSAKLHLQEAGDSREVAVRVGDNGEFALPAMPGDYEISHVTFNFQGEQLQAPTSLVFGVSDDSRASYIGTITLEVTLGSSYHGIVGSYDRFTVRDECATDCERLLSGAGLSPEDAESALAEWRGRVVASR